MFVCKYSMYVLVVGVGLCHRFGGERGPIVIVVVVRVGVRACPHTTAERRPLRRHGDSEDALLHIRFEKGFDETSSLYMLAYIHSFIHTNITEYITIIQTLLHTPINTYKHAYIHIQIKITMYIHTYMYTLQYTYIHTYIHTYVRSYTYMLPIRRG